ncbi:MAG: hypothetical protein U1F27_10540 [Turneriella sp.]
MNGSALIDETYAAVNQAAKLAGKLPVYLAGFLGGNFVLRIAFAFVCRGDTEQNTQSEISSPEPRLSIRMMQRY